MNETIKFIIEKLEEIEVNRREKERDIAELKSTINGLDARVDKVETVLDHKEQYSSRNRLLIHDFDKKNLENTDDVINILKKEMNGEVTHQAIDNTHCLVNQKPDKNKPQRIIIKFSRYNVRAKILKNKRKLKGKQMSVTKSLTKGRIEQ